MRFGDRTLKQGTRAGTSRHCRGTSTRVGIETDVDGVFGPGTKAAVRTFEEAQRRKVDGKVTRTDAKVIKDVAVNGGAVASAVTTGGALPKNQKIVLAERRRTAAAPVLGPGIAATVGADGLAIAPALAPPAIQAVIAAGNKIAKMPYIYGGGHGKWEDAGYDCSGSVSYALHGGGLLETSMPSGGFMKWGEPGPGPVDHGLRQRRPRLHDRRRPALRHERRSRAGTRWQPASERDGKGYTVVHPVGY